MSCGQAEQPFGRPSHICPETTEAGAPSQNGSSAHGRGDARGDPAGVPLILIKAQEAGRARRDPTIVWIGVPRHRDGSDATARWGLANQAEGFEPPWTAFTIATCRTTSVTMISNLRCCRYWEYTVKMPAIRPK